MIFQNEIKPATRTNIIDKNLFFQTLNLNSETSCNNLKKKEILICLIKFVAKIIFVLTFFTMISNLKFYYKLRKFVCLLTRGVYKIYSIRK